VAIARQAANSGEAIWTGHEASGYNGHGGTVSQAHPQRPIFTEDRYPRSTGHESRRRHESEREISGGEGAEPVILFSHYTMVITIRERLKEQVSGPRSQIFM
jgi:hypothetical protein